MPTVVGEWQDKHSISRGIVSMQCSDAPAKGATMGAGHTGEENSMEVSPPARPCLHYTPKWVDSKSRGHGEAAQRAQ